MVESKLELGKENVSAPALGDQWNSWLVLIRQACLFLLQSTAADSPQSSNALMYFQLLDILLSQDLAFIAIGPDGTALCTAIIEYLFNRRELAG